MSSFLILISCTYHNEEDLYGPQICDTSNVSYNLDVKPIFVESCYGCHSKPLQDGTYDGNFNITDTAQIQIRVKNDKLRKYINWEVPNFYMPKDAPKLSDCRIRAIETWINRGAHYN